MTSASSAEQPTELVAADITDPVGGAPRSWAERSAWTLVGVALINWSVQLLGASTSFEWVGGLVVLTGGWGLGTVVASWWPSGAAAPLRRTRSVFPWITAIMVIAAFGAWCYVQVWRAPGYGTDEIAFDQYAAMLAQHGANPYLHSMAPAFSLFRVSPDGFTYTVTGAPVTALSYPALAFELYLPFLALGWVTQLAVGLNVLAWAIAVLLMFALLPRRVRAIGPVIGSVSVYVGYTVGGVTDALYIPLLIGAAYRWDRFGESRWSYLGPVMLGLAMAVKQTPWLIFPFVLCGLGLSAYRSHGRMAAVATVGRYALIALVTFLLPNLPFILASPSAWLHGILIPILDSLVPAGQGAVALALFVKIGGGSLVAFTAAMVAMALVVAVAYIGTYPLLRPATFVLPAIVLFLAARSYGSYLVELVPAAMVGAFTTAVPYPRHLAGGTARWAPRVRTWGAAVALAGSLLVASVAWALLSHAPLRVQIAGIRTTGQLATIEQINLEVTNLTGASQVPAFTLDQGGALTTFWHVARGPRILAPHQTATYTVLSTNFPAQPSIAGGFSVLALTTGPNAVSASSPYVPGVMHVGLNPDAVNYPVRIRQAIVIHALLLNQLNRRVRRAGVAVSLGQVIYGQSGLEFSEARVNGRPPGHTPVVALTNQDGIATFTIVGTSTGRDPVYFEANLVNDRYFFPYGYSEILPIRFKR